MGQAVIFVGESEIFYFCDMEGEDFIRLFLPKFVSSYFDVVEFSDTDNEIHIGLDEKKVILPKHLGMPVIREHQLLLILWQKQQ